MKTGLSSQLSHSLHKYSTFMVMLFLVKWKYI